MLQQRAQTEISAILKPAILGVSVTTISGGSGLITYTPGRYNSGSSIIYTSGTTITFEPVIIYKY